MKFPRYYVTLVFFGTQEGQMCNFDSFLATYVDNMMLLLSILRTLLD